MELCTYGDIILERLRQRPVFFHVALSEQLMDEVHQEIVFNCFFKKLNTVKIVENHACVT